MVNADLELDIALYDQWCRYELLQIGDVSQVRRRVESGHIIESHHYAWCAVM